MIENDGDGLVPEPTGDPAVDAALLDYARATAALNSLDLTSLVRLEGPSTGLHAVARTVEAIRRTTEVFDAGYVAAVESGDEPARYAQASTAVFLREQLRLSPAEARRRVELAHAITSRVAFSGELLPPRLPALAVAVRRGEVSGEHSRIVLATMDRLPEPVRDTHGPVVESELVQAAAKITPAELGRLAEQVIVRTDPDGRLRDAEYRHAHRTGYLVHKRGGGGRLQVDLDDEGLATLHAALDPLLKPIPDGPDGPDSRDPGARLHDAVVVLAELGLRGDRLPACGGTPTTLVIHLNAEQLESRTGFALTDDGDLLPVETALRLADNAAIYTLIRDSRDVPLRLLRTVRIATPGQTVALAARDRGCTFPGCDRPPSWCQRHHVAEWIDGGATDLDNLTLLCGHHHREFGRRGWRVEMRDGLPWWVPPAWIDPERRPVRNQAHVA